MLNNARVISGALFGLCVLLTSQPTQGEFLTDLLGNATGSHFNFSSPFSDEVLTTLDQKFQEAIEGLGEDVKKVYEAQFMSLKKSPPASRQLLIRLAGNPTDEEDDQDDGLLSSVFDPETVTLAGEGSDDIFQEFRKKAEFLYKKWLEIVEKGEKRMGEWLQEQRVKGVKHKFYGAQSGVSILELDEDIDLEEKWTELLAMKDVQFVEPDFRLQMEASSANCPLIEDWGVQHTRTPEALSLLGMDNSDSLERSSVLVAVIDSGIDLEHPALKDRIFVNEAELNGEPGVDDDGNGFIDDINGWNFVQDNNDPTDENGHGTHVAGIIGAAASNDTRVRGVAPNAILLPCKFTDSNQDGTVSDAIRCLEYVWLMGADITSNSWGGEGAYSLSLRTAFSRAESNGKLSVAAAGNNGKDNDGIVTEQIFPASFDHEILVSVAAVDDSGSLLPISNFGAQNVDLGAPGLRVMSTIPGGDYGSMSGTSMATPFVSGAAAVLLGACRNQGLTCNAPQIKKAILDSAFQTGNLDNQVLTEGHLDIAQAAREMGLTLQSSNQQSFNEFRSCNGVGGGLMQMNWLVLVTVAFWALFEYGFLLV